MELLKSLGTVHEEVRLLYYRNLDVAKGIGNVCPIYIEVGGQIDVTNNTELFVQDRPSTKFDSLPITSSNPI